MTVQPGTEGQVDPGEEESQDEKTKAFSEVSCKLFLFPKLIAQLSKQTGCDQGSVRLVTVKWGAATPVTGIGDLNCGVFSRAARRPPFLSPRN